MKANLYLPSIKKIVENISANEGTVPCDWSLLIAGECSCDYCPFVFNISNCLGDYLYRRLK